MEIKEMLDALELKISTANETKMSAKAKAVFETEIKAIETSIAEKIAAAVKAEHDANEVALKAEQVKFDALKNEVENLDVKLKESKLNNPASATKNYATLLTEALKEKEAELKEFASKKSGSINIDIKAAVPITMLDTLLAVGSASHYSLTTNTGIISPIRKRLLTYLTAVSIGAISVDKPYAMWIEELDEQGIPIMIAEGSAKTQLSVRYEEREKKAKKIGVYSKVSTEMLRFLPQLVSFVMTNLVKRMDIKTEDQLFGGDDTGENLKGITSYATSFAPTADIANKIAFANEFDVLNGIATQVQLALGVSSAVFVNPSTLQAMKAIKDANGRPLYEEYMDILGNGDMVVSGQKIISTPMVPVGQFVGGDLSVVHVGFTENSSIQINLDGNDFTNNLRTILIEQQLVQFVSANDVQCLVQGTFATAIAALKATT